MAQKELNNLFADDDEVPALKPRSRAKAAQQAAAPAPSDRVCIVLEDNDEIPPTGQFLQYGAGNEIKSFMLRPGEKAMVPRALLNVLDQAVQEVPIVDRTTQQVVGYKEKLRFPYRVVQDAQAA